MATNLDGPAVKHGGYPAAGKIRPCSLKDRLTKGYDAELLIDENKWNDMSQKRQLAFLDHESSHLALIPRKKKKDDDEDALPYKLDDLGRPKLKSVDGDANVGDMFLHVIARHGYDAIEYDNINTAKRLADAAREEGEAERKSA